MRIEASALSTRDLALGAVILLAALIARPAPAPPARITLQDVLPIPRPPAAPPPPERRPPPRDPFVAMIPVYGREPAPVAPTTIPDEALTPAQPIETVSIAGESFSLDGLDLRQRALLRSIAEVPDLPTKTVRGVRFLIAGARLYRDDCSNALRPPYDALGIDLFAKHHEHPDANGVGLLRLAGVEVAEPRVGDLVIFRNTYDRNGNGALDDLDTHAAIVVGVEEGGTLALYNRVRTGHVIHRMTRSAPGTYRSNGRRLNDVLRRKQPGEPEQTPHSTAELFQAFVRVL